MDIQTLKTALPYLMKAQITPLIWGWHGQGKSQGIRQWVDSMGYAFADERLGQAADVGDLRGLAEFLRDPEGKAIATDFVTPNKFQRVIQYCIENPDSGGVIFLDEINRAGRKDIMQAVFQLILDKELNDKKLPDNLFVLGAANPNTSDYVTLNMDDKALLDRFCHIYFMPSRDEWFTFARDAEYDNDILDFIIEQPKMLEMTEDLEEFSIDEYAVPSRRSWEFVNKLMKADTPLHILQELCYGIVGKTATVSFVDSMKNRDDKPLKPEQILDKYAKYRKKIVKYSDHDTGGRQDILKYTCDNLIRHMQERQQSKEKMSKSEEKNMMSFLKDLPLSVGYDAGRQLYFEEICRPCMDGDLDYQNMIRKARDMEEVANG